MKKLLPGIVRVNLWDSDSFFNFAYLLPAKDKDWLLDTMTAFHFTAGEGGNTKSWLIRALGKQDYCVLLSNKNWVWELGDVRVFYSKRGAVIEVRASLSTKDKFKALQTFLLSLPIEPLSYFENKANRS